MNIKLLFFTLLFFLGCNFFVNYCYALTFSKVDKAVINLLNKSTGKYETKTMTVGSMYTFDGNLVVALRSCYKSSSQDDPENTAFFQIEKIVNKHTEDPTKDISDTIKSPQDFQLKLNPDDYSKLIFSGWLFSSSPSLNALVDNTYDISLIRCYSSE